MSRLDKIRSNWPDSRLLALPGLPPGVSGDDVFAKVSSVDPTPRKKMIGWLLDAWERRGFLWEDIQPGVQSEIYDTLKNFDVIKNRLPEESRSLMKYKTPGEVWEILQPFMDGREEDISESNKAHKRLVMRKARMETITQILPSGMKIEIPLTQFASQIIGRGTRWCTAAEKGNMFGVYADGGPLMVLSIPGGERFQAHLDIEDIGKAIRNGEFSYVMPEMSLMNVADDNLDADEARRLNPYLKDLLAFIERITFSTFGITDKKDTQKMVSTIIGDALYTAVHITKKPAANKIEEDVSKDIIDNKNDVFNRIEDRINNKGQYNKESPSISHLMDRIQARAGEMELILDSISEHKMEKEVAKWCIDNYGDEIFKVPREISIAVSHEDDMRAALLGTKKTHPSYYDKIVDGLIRENKRSEHLQQIMEHTFDDPVERVEALLKSAWEPEYGNIDLHMWGMELIEMLVVVEDFSPDIQKHIKDNAHKILISHSRIDWYDNNIDKINAIVGDLNIKGDDFDIFEIALMLKLVDNMPLSSIKKLTPEAKSFHEIVSLIEMNVKHNGNPSLGQDIINAYHLQSIFPEDVEKAVMSYMVQSPTDKDLDDIANSDIPREEQYESCMTLWSKKRLSDARRFEALVERVSLISDGHLGAIANDQVLKRLNEIKEEETYYRMYREELIPAIKANLDNLLDANDRHGSHVYHHISSIRERAIDYNKPKLS